MVKEILLRSETLVRPLVLSGGGARAAYQVGCLRAVSKALPNYRPQILTGVSAGAINATHLAAFQGSWQESVEALVGLWQQMRTEKVYRHRTRLRDGAE